MRKAYALLVSSLQQTEQFADAHATCRQGLKLYPDDKELLFRNAMLLHQSGRLEKAAGVYRRILAETTDRHFASVDAGIAGIKARHNLAIVYEDLGRLEDAEVEWRAVVSESPGNRTAWRRIGELLLQSGRSSELRTLIDDLARRGGGLAAEGLILTAKFYERSGDSAMCRQILEEAARRSPDDRIVLDELCRILFEGDDASPAVDGPETLGKPDLENAAARHNLGLAYERCSHYEQAIDSYQAALKIDAARSNTRERLKRLYPVAAATSQHETEQEREIAVAL